MITTLQSTGVPHLKWYVLTNSGTNLQPATSRHKKMQAVQKNLSQSRAERSPVDVESHPH